MQGAEYSLTVGDIASEIDGTLGSGDLLTPGGGAADTVPMGASQIGQFSDVFDLSDDRTPLALPFVSTEPAAFAGKIRGKEVDA